MLLNNYLKMCALPLSNMNCKCSKGFLNLLNSQAARFPLKIRNTAEFKSSQVLANDESLVTWKIGRGFKLDAFGINVPRNL